MNEKDLDASYVKCMLMNTSITIDGTTFQFLPYDGIISRTQFAGNLIAFQPGSNLKRPELLWYKCEDIDKKTMLTITDKSYEVIPITHDEINMKIYLEDKWVNLFYKIKTIYR